MRNLSSLLPILPSAAFLVGCGSASKQEAKSTRPQKPNVIYLITDDLGIGDLSCCHQSKHPQYRPPCRSRHAGNEFWQLKHIIDRVEDKNRVGVCLDTCHTYSAGYDIVADYDNVFNEFDATVGFNYLLGIHLNDTKKALGSHVDRHDSIEKGLLGMDFFKRFMQDARFDNMPVILETPDESLWAEEIQLLRSLE